MPDHPHLAYEAWLADRVASGGIPHTVGPESYAEPEGAWAAPGWLGAVCGATLERALGQIPFDLCSAALVVAGFIALEYLVRAAGAPKTLAACTALFVFPACADLLRAGSALAGLAPASLFAALATWLLARHAKLYPVALPFCVAIWCNFSPYGLLATAIAIGFFLGRRSRATAIAALLSLAASFATPGVGLFVQSAFLELKLDALLVIFNDAESDRSAYPIATSVALPTAAITLAIFARSKRSPERLIAVAGGFAAIVVNAIYLPVLAAVAATVVIPEAGRLRARGTVLGAVTAVLGLYSIALAATEPQHDAATARYEDESSLIVSARTHGAHRLLCTLVAWCDESLEPGPTVYADDRYEAQPWAAYRDVFNVRFMVRGWPDSMRRAAPDALIVGRREPPVQILGTTPGWRLISCTSSACLLMKVRGS